MQTQKPENPVNMISEADAEEYAQVHDAILRLLDNQDFITVFMEKYQREEPARLTSLLADPNAQDIQKEIRKQLYAISAFGQWIRTRLLMGKSAKEALKNQGTEESESSSYVD